MLPSDRDLKPGAVAQMEDKPRVEVGRIWGDYVVDRLIGEGTNAIVYQVHHSRKPEVPLAMKVLARVDARRRARIAQEAGLREGLVHPNIVRTLAMLDVDGTPALITEYVDGPSLERWLARDSKADLLERLRLFRGICEGCGFAHGWSLVHRDLKPSNVLMQRRTNRAGARTLEPRISDFGLAKALAHEVGRYGGLTTVNTGLGTVGYAAPEQVRDAANVDHRADLYSLGCILYELTCGVGPFAGLSALETLQAQRDGRYRRPEDLVPGLPPALYDLIRQLMAPRPDARPADCAEVLSRLTAVEQALRLSSSGPAARDLYKSDLLIYMLLGAVPMLFLLVGTLYVSL
jgi:serine/threonine protein kinase